MSQGRAHRSATARAFLAGDEIKRSSVRHTCVCASNSGVSGYSSISVPAIARTVHAGRVARMAFSIGSNGVSSLAMRGVAQQFVEDGRLASELALRSTGSQSPRNAVDGHSVFGQCVDLFSAQHRDRAKRLDRRCASRQGPVAEPGATALSARKIASTTGNSSGC